MTIAAPVRSTTVSMDTIVTAEVISAEPVATVQAAVQRALGWFGVVEGACSRFDERSEVRRLLARVGEPVAASPVVFEAARFALALARLTKGAFDPTIGHLLESKGFDRHYVTGERVRSSVPPGERVSYHDVRLDSRRHTITLRRPLVLDLGAVAKGLAIDLAARELAAYENVAIDAGGDLYVKGANARGEPWRIGVEDPRREPSGCGALAYVLDAGTALPGVRNVRPHPTKTAANPLPGSAVPTAPERAVCTSGDYERRTADGAEHHLLDPRTGHAADALASVTVIAPTALAADGLATAAFVLGLERGRALLEREGVGGVFITPDGQVQTTRQLHETLGATK